MGALSVKDTAIIGAGILIALALLRGNAGAVASGVVKAGAEAAAGAVVGLGEVVGVPPTDRTKFEQDVANNDWWAASFSGTATEFIGAAWEHMWSGDNSGTPKGGGGASGSW